MYLSKVKSSKKELSAVKFSNCSDCDTLYSKCTET